MSKESPTLERIDPRWLNPNNLIKIWRGQTDIYPLSPIGVHFIWNEHKARYRFASQIALGETLDISCGTGYGFNFLNSDKIKSYLGVDLNRKALARAKEVIRDKSNLELLQLNANFTLPFQDKSFDTIISFETIEHITDQSKLLKEIERILKDDGKFVVSTSNKEVFSSNSNQPINHFHTKEFGISEFKTSLGLVFKKIKYYSQGELQDFEIKKPSSIQSRVNRIVGMLNGRQTSVLNMNDNIPRYFVAVCSKF